MTVFARLLATAAGLLLSLASPAVAGQSLTFATTAFPPYSFDDPGAERPGFINELVIESFRRAGHDAKIEIYPWARAQELAKQGTVTGSFKSTRTKDFEKTFLYTDSFGEIVGGFFVTDRHQGPAITALEQVRGLKAAANRGYSLSRALTDAKIPHARISSEEQGLKMLTFGRVDLYFAYLAPTCHIKVRDKIAGKLAFHPYETYPYHMIVNRNWPEAATLVQQFDAAIRTMRADGTFDRIMARYDLTDACFH